MGEKVGGQRARTNWTSVPVLSVARSTAPGILPLLQATSNSSSMDDILHELWAKRSDF
jgi:hypothetical protein